MGVPGAVALVLAIGLARHSGMGAHASLAFSISKTSMSIHVALRHVTHYKYDRPVTIGPQVVRLRPAPHCRTPVLSYSLRIEPAEHFINWQLDPQANYLARLVFPKKAREFRVEVEMAPPPSPVPA